MEPIVTTNNLPIPAGYQTVMPYLILKNAAAFLQFTQDVFGAFEKYRTMRDEDHIAHAELTIGDSTIMLADSTEQYPPSTAGMFVFVASADETYQKAIDAGATSVMELSDQPYGRTCGVQDPFGNVWWITTASA